MTLIHDSSTNMYIGRYKILKTRNLDDSFIEITLKEHRPITLHKELYDLVIQETPMENAEVTDAIVHTFAVKFVSELAKYKLDFYLGRTIGEKMGILCHNLRERLLAKTFNCSGGDNISLDKVIERL
ncbi:MAG: hypothetical protein UT24_C0020G0010 [Candidatus Woesebacteria bacterium GW2011_GWB1_39_12]|uniref:Uncharacterized protein n=1 Tax=Candidatus Woesebacteria bacterium GW2011_GWB1_39_12 TaxID=1618574 RepID=A0A0G0M9L7_9BACT|nr:MAG: hypothetical protein UT24_C0020G0010 [Candidatus Woesebacteria bacterium GW2011_GWB1_39_12]